STSIHQEIEYWVWLASVAIEGVEIEHAWPAGQGILREPLMLILGNVSREPGRVLDYVLIKSRSPSGFTSTKPKGFKLRPHPHTLPPPDRGGPGRYRGHALPRAAIHLGAGPAGPPRPGRGCAAGA